MTATNRLAVSPPYRKSAGGSQLDQLTSAQLAGLGVDDFELYVALREARRASGAPAAPYLVSWPFNVSLADATAAGGSQPFIFSQRQSLVPQLVPPGQAIDGVMAIQVASGAYTPNNFNGAAAYTYDGTAFTRQAITANIPAAWSGALGITLLPFTAQLPAAGAWRLVWASHLYCASAQTTQPQLAGITATHGQAKTLNLGNWGFGDDVLAATTMAVSIPNASVTTTVAARMWLAFYRTYA